MTTSPEASGGPQGTIVAAARSRRPIDPGVTIGHVHLRTSDIDRVRAFYVDVLGWDVVMEARGVPGWGTTGDMLFVSAGGYQQHLGFNTWKSAGGGPQPDGVAGRHHVAIRYPTRAGLADALRRRREHRPRSRHANQGRAGGVSAGGSQPVGGRLPPTPVARPGVGGGPTLPG